MGTDSPISLANRQIRHYSKAEFAKVFNSILGERLPSRPVQEIDEESLVQNYVVGSRRVEGSTVYHYAKILAGFSIGLASQCRGVVNSCTGHFQNTSAIDIAVGSMTISILDAVSAAHLYRNGRIVVWGVAEWHTYDIVDSDASDGVNVVLHLNRPVRVAIPAGTFTEAHENPYSAVRPPSGDGFETFVGIPQRYVTDGYYFWLPTWGLVNSTPGAPMGGNIQERQLVFDVADGSVQLAGIDYGLPTQRQMAGYVYAHTDTGADTMMWLTLDS